MFSAGKDYIYTTGLALVLFALGFFVLMPLGCAQWLPGREDGGGFPFPGNNFILIEKERNRLYLYEAGRPVKSYPVSTGKERGLTPEGRFKVVKRFENPGGALGSRWMGLDVPGHEDGLKYGIHGTDEPEKIGLHVSGGCVRLRNEHVEELYDRTEKGILVLIHP